MSRQAQLGLFAVVALALLFGIFYVITDFGTRHSGYRIGVHFASAAGLPTGAQVFFSGVTVGTVDQVQLLPDNTVDVILAIQNNINIPKDSKFLIQAPLTGTPNMIIVPPVSKPAPGVVATPLPDYAILPKTILPLNEQPVGAASPTIADLLQSGQGEVRRLDSMLATLEDREPKLLNTLQTALENVDTMTTQLKGTVADLSGTLDTTMTQAGSNIVGMTDTLNSTLTRNQYKVDTLISSLDATAVALNKSMDSLQSLASDPRLKNNLIETTQNVRELTGNVAGLTGDLRTITGNPQTQAQLRDTVAHLDATMQKANSLLGSLGGESHVYGVDEGATPYPVPSPGATLPPLPASAAGTSAGTPPESKHATALKHSLASVISNLADVQLRLSYLTPQYVGGPQPLLTKDRGPMADINAVLLPRGGYSFMLGVNDIGATSTVNALVMKNLHSGFHLGGGVLYSRIGILTKYDGGPVGAEARIYDLRLPTFDLYGDFNVARWAKLFLGERDVTRSDRRTVFGLQLDF